MTSTSVVHNTVSQAFSGTVGQLITATITIATPSPSKASNPSILAPPHTSPARFNSKDPIILFCIQAGIIILLTRILAYGLGKMRQPRVIAEVIGGILLGPSVMGRIPGFTEHIFPPASTSYLNLVATLGLILFLFLVGLEVDFAVFKKNRVPAITISIAGMVLPFGLGAAVSVGLYNQYVTDDDNVSFGHFLLFVSVAMAITAFPVLCRILTELKLLHNKVGVAVLAAGVGNDVVGWVLLALTIALVNAGQGITALYIILCAFGWILILVFLGRPALIRLAQSTGSFEHGPSNVFIVVVILLILLSAFITNIIGIHAMFGGFLVGVIMPHHRGFTESLTEKIEDLVSTLFLPIYFTLSGLSTNLGLLNNGTIWGWAVCVIATAFVSKFSGCFLAARLNGYTWRESAAVGSLMSCKGLVELIVLNVGLEAGILNDAVFAMFVLMALLTTFATTPLTLLFYPLSYRQQQLAADKTHVGGEAGISVRAPSYTSSNSESLQRVALVLNRFEHLPLIMSFTKMLQTPVQYGVGVGKDEKAAASAPTSNQVSIDALRLLELTERTSAVMKAADHEETAKRDPLGNIYGTFAGLNGFSVKPEMAIVLPEDFAHTVTTFAEERESQLVVIPWAAAASVETSEGPSSPMSNPLDNLFQTNSLGSLDRSPLYAAFVRKVFLNAPCNVALFMDRGVFGTPSALPAGRQHIFMPFHGGPDDRTALDLVVQFCRHPGVTATVTRFIRAAEETQDDGLLSTKTTNATAVEPSNLAQFTIHGGVVGGDTIYGADTTQTRLASDTADNLAIAHYFESATDDKGQPVANHSQGVTEALSRITFTQVSTASPLATTLVHAEKVAGASISAPLLIVTGRSRKGAPSHRDELTQFLKEHTVTNNGLASLGIAASSEVRKTLGDVGSALIAKSVAGSLLIVQGR